MSSEPSIIPRDAERALPEFSLRSLRSRWLNFLPQRAQRTQRPAAAGARRLTAASRLGFDAVGFMTVIRHSLSPLPAAVAQLGS